MHLLSDLMKGKYVALKITAEDRKEWQKWAASHTPASQQKKPGIERVQALADISHSALYCHSNEITNPPNSAQLEGTPTIPPTYIRVCAVVWECGEGQTDRHTDGHDNIHFALAMPQAKCNKQVLWLTDNQVLTVKIQTLQGHL